MNVGFVRTYWSDATFIGKELGRGAAVGQHGRVTTAPLEAVPAAPGPTLHTARLLLRPVAEDDAPTLRAIRRSPEVARWWHASGPGWPLSPEPGVTRLVVELAGAPGIGPEGAIVGLAQAYEGDDPDYAVSGIDLFLAASVHRRGLGREAVTAVRDWLVRDRGHHRVTLDPAAANTAAIACYQACGFEPVGVLRRYERDTDGIGWHDGLLMEYLA